MILNSTNYNLSSPRMSNPLHLRIIASCHHVIVCYTINCINLDET